MQKLRKNTYTGTTRDTYPTWIVNTTPHSYSTCVKGGHPSQILQLNQYALWVSITYLLGISKQAEIDVFEFQYYDYFD